MNEILKLILRGLRAMFGQDALWEAVKAVVETRGKLKLLKFDLEKEEEAELRRLKIEIKEERKRRRLSNVSKKRSKDTGHKD